MTGLSAAKRRELAYELSALLSYLPPRSAAADHTLLAHTALKDERLTAAVEHLHRAIDADAATPDLRRRRRMADLHTTLSAAIGAVPTKEDPQP